MKNVQLAATHSLRYATPVRLETLEEGSGDVVYLLINCCISEQINNVPERFRSPAEPVVY